MIFVDARVVAVFDGSESKADFDAVFSGLHCEQFISLFQDPLHASGMFSLCAVAAKKIRSPFLFSFGKCANAFGTTKSARYLICSFSPYHC